MAPPASRRASSTPSSRMARSCALTALLLCILLPAEAGVTAGPDACELAPGGMAALRSQLLTRAVSYAALARPWLGLNVSDAWARRSPHSAALREVEDAVEAIGELRPAPSSSTLWEACVEHAMGILDRVARDHAQELRALVGRLLHIVARLDEATRSGPWSADYSALHHVMVLYRAGGRYDLATAIHAAAWRWHYTPPRPIPRHLLADWRLISLPPICPTIPRAEGVLRGGLLASLVGRRLVGALAGDWRVLAAEARWAVFSGDVWPSIITQKRWQGLRLYAAGYGWNAAACAQLPAACGLLRGRLASEHPQVRDWLFGPFRGLPNDEEVTLFALHPRSEVPVHSGQYGRLNLHLCLLGCEEAYLELGGGPRRGGQRIHYRAGEMIAFDDALQHGVENLGASTRIMLAIGSLHPGLTRAHHRHCDD